VRGHRPRADRWGTLIRPPASGHRLHPTADGHVRGHPARHGGRAVRGGRSARFRALAHGEGVPALGREQAPVRRPRARGRRGGPGGRVLAAGRAEHPDARDARRERHGHQAPAGDDLRQVRDRPRPREGVRAHRQEGEVQARAGDTGLRVPVHIGQEQAGRGRRRRRVEVVADRGGVAREGGALGVDHDPVQAARGLPGRRAGRQRAGAAEQPRRADAGVARRTASPPAARRCAAGSRRRGRSAAAGRPSRSSRTRARGPAAARRTGRRSRARRPAGCPRRPARRTRPPRRSPARGRPWRRPPPWTLGRGGGAPRRAGGRGGGRLVDAVPALARDPGLERVTGHSGERAVSACERGGFAVSPVLRQAEAGRGG